MLNRIREAAPGIDMAWRPIPSERQLSQLVASRPAEGLRRKLIPDPTNRKAGFLDHPGWLFLAGAVWILGLLSLVKGLRESRVSYAGLGVGTFLLTSAYAGDHLAWFSASVTGLMGGLGVVGCIVGLSFLIQPNPDPLDYD